MKGRYFYSLALICNTRQSFMQSISTNNDSEIKTLYHVIGDFCVNNDSFTN